MGAAHEESLPAAAKGKEGDLGEPPCQQPQTKGAIMEEDLLIRRLEAIELDRLEPLWRSLLDHVRNAGSVVPIRAHEESWPKRRALYEAWLTEGESFVLGAFRDDRLVAYAMVRVSEPDAVWVTGTRYAELMSLSVAPAERGNGVGTALLDDVEARLLVQGIDELVIGVDAPNEGARRFYEGRGFRVGYHLMHGHLQTRRGSGQPAGTAQGTSTTIAETAPGAATTAPSSMTPETAGHGDD
jgi:ribosomal protein S18 acetylase RimI-like enzyme